MTRIREAILVEGRYDVNTVRQVVDTVVLESGGFRIFNNKDQLKLLRRIAETRGLIVLTDSDGAGFVIRNYLKGALPKGCVKQAYVPDIAGKERRKRHGSKEGKLGVEGMRPQVILDALRRAGATFAQQDESEMPVHPVITKADFYEWGLSGRPDSTARRAAVLRRAVQALPFGFGNIAVPLGGQIIQRLKAGIVACAVIFRFGVAQPGNQPVCPGGHS